MLRLTLDSPYGTVVAPHEHLEYDLIRLDSPATYRRADGSVEQVDRVREVSDNLDALEGGVSTG